MNYEDLSDLDLLERVTERDAAALSALYDRYGRRVFALGARILNDPISCEEVTQDVFLSIWRRSASYNPGKGRFTTWLFSIAHNRAIDELRRRRRYGGTYSDDIDAHLDISSDDSSPDEWAVAQSEYAMVRNALDTLPPPQRAVVALAYFHGLTQVEIARKLEQPLGTVKTRMRLALKKLRTALEPRVGLANHEIG